MPMNKIAGNFSTIEQVTGQYFSSNPVNNSGAQTDISFDDVLKQKQAETQTENSTLKFSRHASMRLSDRNINLTQSQNARLENGVEQASEKGIQESLVLVDSLAFIVNVPSRTVVTALDQAEAANNIFTNIDGAVIT
jgi:flagellar operon protein